jgi:hypothetical protein
MSNQKLLAALPLAALFAALMMHQPAHAGGQEGMVVVRDPQTGQMRAPTAQEMQALHPLPKASLRAQAPLSSLVVTKPNGSRALRLGERGLVYSVVRRAPDGSLAEQCVQGQEAASKALAQPAPASHKEHSHEDR